MSDEQAAAQAPAMDQSAQNVVYSVNQLRRARDLLARFYGARRMLRFYPPGHQAVDEIVSGLLELLTAYFDEGVDVVLTFYEDELLLGEQLLAEESVLFDQLVRDMMEIGADNVTFVRGIDRDELSRSVRVLATDAAELASAGGVAAVMAAVDVPHVKVRALSAAEHSQLAGGEEEGGGEAARESYQAAIELLRDLQRVVETNGSIFAGPVRGVVRGLLDNVLSNRFAMLQLSGLRDYDEYTFYHSVNVAILSLALGATITHDQRFLSSLGVGSLMHDIGKVLIDPETINRPGTLSADEWAQVRRHPLYGAEQVAITAGLDKSSVVMILEHHMRFDMCGYPERFPVRGQQLASRIVAVADAFDAMTSKRSYSAARLPDEAVAILAEQSGTAFDPRLVRLFIEMMGCYPPRSVVRLNSGETAVVLSASPGEPLRPRVRVFADASGAVVAPFDVDLSLDAEAAGRSVDRCLDAGGLNVDVEEFLP